MSGLEGDRSSDLGDLLAVLAETGRLPNGGPGLKALDAGREALRAFADDNVRPAWRDPETGGLALSGAALAGVSLSRAVLVGANLRRAVLTKASGDGADLSEAILEAAKLDGADFAGARFVSIKAGEADFSGAMLEDAQFDGAMLRYANFAKTSLDAATFARADLWGATLDGTDADEAVFRGARLDEASLVDGNFTGADFSDATLKKCNLSGARLRGVNLTGAQLGGAKLAGADLSQASLPRLNLLNCDLTHVRMAGAWLELTRMQASQFGGAIGEEMAHQFEDARQAYIALEQNFRTLGNSDDESWAFRKRRIMGKKHKAVQLRHAVADRSWRRTTDLGARWLADIFVEWLCDYGESLGRVVRAFVAMILAFALVYVATGALIRIDANGTALVTRAPLDALAYSFLNMLTTNIPDIGVKPANELVTIVSSIQGAIGIVLIGLFGYVLGNRMHR